MSLRANVLHLPESATFLLSERLKENNQLIEKAGFSVTNTTVYPFTKHPYQVLVKYTCSFSHWKLTIKDIMDPEKTEGILLLSDVEDVLTGETHGVFCNLKGGALDVNRLISLKDMMKNGFKNQLNKLEGVFVSFSDKLEEEGYEITDNDLQFSIRSSQGAIVFTDQLNTLVSRMIEDENGLLCLSVSNSEYWTNPNQNRSQVKGKLFPIVDGEIPMEECLDYIRSFFEDLEAGIPLASYPIGNLESAYYSF